MSYLAHKCWRKIKHLYQLEYQMLEKVEKRVKWLLKKDRYVCREETREVSGHQRLLNGINKDGTGVGPEVSDIANCNVDI